MPSKLGPLGLVEVLDRTGAALNRVEPEAFVARFAERQAVQYFYEPFLEAFDPELRKELGVWYTPPEIVHRTPVPAQVMHSRTLRRLTPSRAFSVLWP